MRKLEEERLKEIHDLEKALNSKDEKEMEFNAKEAGLSKEEVNKLKDELSKLENEREKY